jgi:hypothetical protein
MNLQMKSNVQNHRSASRGKTQQARGSAAHREESSFSNIKSALRRANEWSFVEDYNLEHTVLHTSIIQETSSAGSDFVGHSVPGETRARAYDRNLPNCVYLG